MLYMAVAGAAGGQSGCRYLGDPEKLLWHWGQLEHGAV